MPKRTAQTIAQTTESQQSGKATGKYRRGEHPNTLANLAPYQFKPGESGNPSGRPKRDVASDICRALFEGNAEQIYEALGREIIKKGSAYAFQVASDRAYGKLKQSLVHTGDEDGGPINANLTVTFVKPVDKE